MKKRNRILAILIVVIFSSCEKDESLVQEFSLNSSSFSDCKNEKGATFYSNESVKYRYEKGDLLYFLHQNVAFNCCQSENNLTVVASLVGDSIIINEFEKEPGMCKCICPYDMECRVGPLKEKQYWIIVKNGEIESFRFPVYFDKELDGVKSL